MSNLPYTLAIMHKIIYHRHTATCEWKHIASYLNIKHIISYNFDCKTATFLWAEFHAAILS